MEELKKLKELADEFFEEAEKFIAKQKEKKTFGLEDYNFRVNSDGWSKRTNEQGQEYLVNLRGDIWELINCEDTESNGQQLFTWQAAMRETQKVGKRMPTDKEWNEFEKEDIPNIVYSGYRSTNGSCHGRSNLSTLWSSTESGTAAWERYLYYDRSTVSRRDGTKASGFSVRCIK